MKNLTKKIRGPIWNHGKVHGFISYEVSGLIIKETEYHIRYSGFRYSGLTRVRYAISSQMHIQLKIVEISY